MTGCVFLECLGISGCGHVHMFQDISACIWVCARVCVGVSLYVYRCVVHHRVFVPMPFLYTYVGGRGSAWLPDVL